jgi:hypothetical protein
MLRALVQSRPPGDLQAEDLLPLFTGILNPVVSFVIAGSDSTVVGRFRPALPGVAERNHLKRARHHDGRIRLVVQVGEKVTDNPVEPEEVIKPPGRLPEEICG